MKTLMVVDGQGGGVGKLIVERMIARELPIDVFACGTNSVATSAMLRAGATDAATGENAITYNAAYADFIAGPVGIIAANSMLGEISPAMATAIASSPAPKLLIPINKCNVFIVGADSQGLSRSVDALIDKIASSLTIES